MKKSFQFDFMDNAMVLVKFNIFVFTIIYSSDKQLLVDEDIQNIKLLKDVYIDNFTVYSLTHMSLKCR